MGLGFGGLGAKWVWGVWRYGRVVRCGVVRGKDLHVSCNYSFLCIMASEFGPKHTQILLSKNLR